MAKTTVQFECIECGHTSPKWLGKCPSCGQWNSFQESILEKKSRSNSSVSSARAPVKKISEVSFEKSERIKVGIGEFDRVIGGGLTKGSLTLIGGEPGIGKSTLLLEVVSCLSKTTASNSILYVSGEESEGQIAQRVQRLENSKNADFLILNETNWPQIKTAIEEYKPTYLILDSIQTTINPDIASAPGTLSQIREVTYELMNLAKGQGITCFVIGHVTKDGFIAGPKVLEHMVDTVLFFEGDQLGQYRLLRAIKNRFGNTNEVGIFEMSEAGLLEVKNPSLFFIDSRNDNSYGRAVTCILEGSRPLLVEIQALVVENKFGNARRTTQGFDQNRLSMLIAIIEKYLGIPISFNDIYVNVVGGIKLQGRESDLAVIAAILSSYLMKPISMDTVLIGEAGLSGETRLVSMMDRRIKELEHMNYKRLVTASHPEKKVFSNRMSILEVDKISKLKEALFKV